MRSCVGLFGTPWTVAHQASLFTGFSRQEYWSGLPCPPPGGLPHPQTEPTPPALADGFFTTEPQAGSPRLDCCWLRKCSHGKGLPTMWETWVRSLGQSLWRRKWQPTPVLLLGKSHGWRSLVGYSLWGRKELDMTERLHSLFTKGPSKVGVKTPWVRVWGGWGLNCVSETGF